jgi:hypothetical protein
MLKSFTDFLPLALTVSYRPGVAIDLGSARRVVIASDLEILEGVICWIVYLEVAFHDHAVGRPRVLQFDVPNYVLFGIKRRRVICRDGPRGLPVVAVLHTSSSQQAEYSETKD